MTTKACILAGVCEWRTTVTAQSQGESCAIVIKSPCSSVKSLAAELTEVDPLSEVLSSNGTARIWPLAAKHRLHAACPVPVGILKAIEVEAGLALPGDVAITISRE